MRPLFNQVSIVGLGLVGGSLGLALRRRRIARRVIGFSRHEKTIRRAIRRGAIHDGDTELCPNWLGESDLVVLAVPPEKVVSTAREVARLTRHSFLMTDVTSVKGPIVRALEKALPRRIRFVGSHPMAGSERSGISAADGVLFHGAPCIVTPSGRAKAGAVRKVSGMWKAVGGSVILLPPERHDRLVAQISHVPHLAAAALARAADGSALRLSAGGFADTTRVALSDPQMWSQIVQMNREEVARALGRFIRILEKFRRQIRRDAAAQLSGELKAARRRRRRIEPARRRR